MQNEMVTEYLNGFINRVENIHDLLLLCLKPSDSRAGAFFIRTGETTKYDCVEHVHLDIKKNHIVTFEAVSTVENITIGQNTEYQAPYTVETTMIIPIMIHKDNIGILCLVNGTYTETLIETLTPLISLSQLILNKRKLIEDYKKIYSDASYASKDLFLANMSHEIRTPLNGVVGYNQLLMKTTLTPIQRSYLSSMNQCSIQLMTIINDILDFSRLSSGKMGINTECFSVKELIESVRDAVDRCVIDKKQACNYNVDSNVPQFIILDKQKLVQILINLISNANKFTDIGGKIDITISCSNENLEISVKDNGMGISEREQCKLFNTFMQINASLCKSGTGLGLAISKKLVELLEGEITVNSALGVGSVFTFSAKYKLFEDFEQIVTKDAKLLKGKKILLVDDNTDNRIVLSSMLFEWDIIPVVCASSLEALSLISQKRYKFDLGLIDICMPGMSGSDLAKQIKEISPFLPLVALSSLDTYLNNGDFVHKLDKPINKVQLFSIIHKVLSKSQKISSYLGNEDVDYTETICQNNKNVKIIVAEDISYNRTLLVTMLQELCYTNIDEAENGKIAFDMIHKAWSENNPYDILLLDLRMPVMDGYDVMDSIEKAGWKLPKIIVVTASTMDFDRTRCKDAGVKFFINKPIEMANLKETIIHVSSDK